MAASVYGFTTPVLPFTCEPDVYCWSVCNVNRKSTEFLAEETQKLVETRG
jgi:hypothetical protein